MTPKEFNTLTRNIFKSKLSQYGFKNYKDIFYLHKPPNIIAILKHYQKDYFQGFYIVATNDFLLPHKNDLTDLALPPFLEHYPFSIPIDELESQYKKFDTVFSFNYDTNFLTRVILPTRTNNGSILSMYDKIRRDESLATSVINSVADKTIEFGVKLHNEYSPNVSYQSVTRHKKVNDPTLTKFKNALEKYCLDNNITLQSRKKSWLSFFRQ